MFSMNVPFDVRFRDSVHLQSKIVLILHGVDYGPQTTHVNGSVTP